MNDNELQQMVDQVRFRATTSKQYENNPHEYVLPHWNEPCRALCRAMREVISAKGYSKVYGGWTYSYYHLNGWKYWFCDVVLNREQLVDKRRTAGA